MRWGVLHLCFEINNNVKHELKKMWDNSEYSDISTCVIDFWVLATILYSFLFFYFSLRTHLPKANFAVLMFSPCAAWGDYFFVQSSFVWGLNELWDWAQRLKRTSRSEKSKEYQFKKFIKSAPGPWYLFTHGTHSLERGFLRLECMSFRRKSGLHVLLCTFSFNLDRTLRLESETATRQILRNNKYAQHNGGHMPRKMSFSAKYHFYDLV